jgi:hypothetical protein
VEEPMTTGARTSSEPEPISLPRAKTSDPKPVLQHDRRRAHRPTTRHVSTRNVHPPTTNHARVGTTVEAPANLLSFLKKLITPEQQPVARLHKSRARRAAQR